jgi:MFS family permease
MQGIEQTSLANDVSAAYGILSDEKIRRAMGCRVEVFPGNLQSEMSQFGNEILRRPFRIIGQKQEGCAVPLEALGLLVAVTTAGYLTSSFLGGAILRRLSIGVVLALSTAAAAAALLGFAVSPRWPVMVALGFVAGLGGGAIDATIAATSGPCGAVASS